ncbi:MAG TPA: hypothetical protein VFH73_07805 [Polyangia bacterium]|jgi:hypothetical protein|nr:hypothetical protein [Polyangia bacterium]
MRCFGVTATVTLAFIGAGAGCAGVKYSPGQSDGGGGKGGNGSGGTLPGGGSGGVGSRPDGGATFPLAGKIKSDSPDTITVSGKPLPVQLTVQLNDGTTPPRITWAVDNVAIGSVGGDGVFTPNGTVGGVATVTATVGAGVATTTITVDVDITDNPNTLNPMDTATLKAGGQGDPQFKWLYPYDKTVFPRGLTPPTIQFAGTGSRATLMTITAPHFHYQQFTNLNDPLQVKIPPAIWKGLTFTAGPKVPVNVTVNKLAGNLGSGPVTQTWFIAPASINGVIYYSTYTGSMLAMGQGGIIRIPAGKDAELVVSAGGGVVGGVNNGNKCTACHSVSANGSVLAAGSQNAPNAMGDWNPVTSQTYDLTPTGAATVRTQSTDGQLFSFVGLTPDGRMGLVSGLAPKRNWPFLPHGVFSTPGTPSKLVDTATGMDIVSPSLGQLVQYASTPAFSPDGAQVAFINSDKLGAMCTDKTCTGACLQTCQRVLSLMDFDGKASPPAFSNLRDLVAGAGAGAAVAWPTFLPDGKGVIFQQGNSLDSDVFVCDSCPLTPQFGDLQLAETQDKTVKKLNAVNGRDANGQLYLPYGEMIEGQMNYEASVLPVAVGGYYWVLFTSRRAYGNMISPTSGDPAGNDPFGSQANPSARKKIWIAAIDIDHAGKPDPSHPAFYLPGQELRTANMRAFAALAPCKQNNMSCETGADCCGGFCRETSRTPDGMPVLQCIPPPANTCANTNELCKIAADCCNPFDLCINNRCAYVIP